MQWSDINFRPQSKTLRQFAVLWTLFLLGAAAWQWFLHGRATLATVLLVAGLAFGVTGIVRPASIRWLFVALSVATFPIGWLVSWLLFAALFFVVFTPLALFFRLIGRDPLDRRFDKKLRSYWAEKPPAPDARRYFRQY